MSDAVIDPAEPAPDPAPAAVPDATGHGQNGPLLKMAVGAIGVVFGDIGTSPLYALRDQRGIGGARILDRRLGRPLLAG